MTIYLGMIISLICLVLGLIVTSSRIKPWKKGIVLVSLLGIGVLSYRALDSFKGQPAQLQITSADILMLSFHVNREAGVIYLWFTHGDDPEPKTYQVPYSQRLEQQLQAMFRKHQGKPYEAKLTTKLNSLNRFNRIVEEVDIDDDIIKMPLKGAQ